MFSPPCSQIHILRSYLKQANITRMISDEFKDYLSKVKADQLLEVSHYQHEPAICSYQ